MLAAAPGHPCLWPQCTRTASPTPPRLDGCTPHRRRRACRPHGHAAHAMCTRYTCRAAPPAARGGGRRGA
eukprot:773266-Prymnesium_polylepis.1